MIYGENRMNDNAMYDSRMNGGMDHNSFDSRRRDYNNMMDQRGGADYGMYDMRMRDYHGGKKLSDQDLMYWSRSLMGELEEKDKQMVRMEMVIDKAERMGIRFDKFTPSEFYTTVLMKFTDHKQTLGNNIDIYIKLAKEFLCDPDTNLRYGEKLAAYYNYIVV